MSPSQALEMLDQAVATIQTNREVHARLQQALQVLEQALSETESKQTK